MATVQLVRHGKAAAGFGAHPDPGLDDLGRRQAAAVAAMLNAQHSQRPELLSSPMARAFETAQALADIWQVPIDVEPRVAEIPSPTKDLEARASWLSQAMAGNWSQLDASVQTVASEAGGLSTQLRAGLYYFQPLCSDQRGSRGGHERRPHAHLRA